MNKHEPHFACVGCSREQSFPAYYLRTHSGKLWCGYCWNMKMRVETDIEFIDLPQFVPAADQKIQALTEGLQAIKRHLETMGVGKISTVWNIADSALVKAEAIGK